jgi:hypothetical protein
MMSPILALRQGIVVCFQKNAQLSNTFLKDVHLYDHVPAGVRGVYITFGDASARPLALHDKDYEYEVNFSLLVWSTPDSHQEGGEQLSYGNSKRALEVASYLVKLLNNTLLKIPEHEVLVMRSTSEKITRDILTGSACAEICFQAMTISK